MSHKKIRYEAQVKLMTLAKVTAIILGLILVAGVALADTQVYRLELDTDSDIPSIVGQDGVKRQVAIVEPEQYAFLTGRVERVWKTMNSTHDGRVKLHGKKTETIVDTNTLTRTDVYADGYRHVESFEVKKTEVMRTFKGIKREVKTVKIDDNEKPKGMDERRWKMRQAYIRRMQKKAKEVFVEHDAATGKDEVK